MAERGTMMDQYRKIKARHRDAVLFFRLGDFYEMFFEDAVEASALLDLTLTHRQGEPMCGVPYHAARSYIARLLRHGKKIAICEQLTEAGPSKGLMERDVVEVVTPGTTVEEDFLDQGTNNYILAACSSDGRGSARSLCMAYMDVSTGEFRAFSNPDPGGQESAEALRAQLYRLAPREMIVQQSLLERPELAEAVAEAEGLVVNRYPDWSFDADQSSRDIAARFGLSSLKGCGFEDGAPELAAAGALLRYVDETARSASPQLSPPLPFREDEFVSIDEGTRKNLEIVRNMSDSGRAYSLIAALDFTRTAPGARLLRQWLLQPLRSRPAAEARLDAVEFLYRDQALLARLREALGGVRDVERLASRVAMDKAHAKDLLALALSIRGCADARDLVAGALGAAGTAGARSVLTGEGEDLALRPAMAAADAIEAAIMDEPSILLTEGGLIRDGFDAELDRLRSLKSDSSGLLDAYVEEERAATGIATLRVRYNKIIGHYLEVSKGRLDAVPRHFIRRQSLVAGERFTTARLSELESDINGATERIVELERRLFLDLRASVKRAVAGILELGRAAAVRDCVASFAWAATARGYARPRLADEPILRIAEGRHPVVEAHLGSGAFVPNGIRLDARIGGRPDGDPAFALITGPNMAGKSTFLRQTALIALMAQAGSFVPAGEAEIGMIDKIYCRVGAQDNLARGESTFLVEMHETAYILNTATPSSLVVMDEVGRGTSTIDGLAIAWAVSEGILDGIGCRALFATHYHELTAMGHPRMRNYSMAVLEEDEDVVFLKRIEEGPAEGSYGIHVAKLAGLPRVVLERARRIQAELERKERSLPSASAAGAGPAARETAASDSAKPRGTAKPAAQEGLFSTGDLILAELASLDTDKLTPLEALNRLSDLRRRLQA
jgi:DNA mismatch repair protein MutS